MGVKSAPIAPTAWIATPTAANPSATRAMGLMRSRNRKAPTAAFSKMAEIP